MTQRVQTEAVTTNDRDGVRYRGVRKRSSGSYGARIMDPLKKTRVSIGSYDNPEDAARAYDKSAIEYFGAKAKTNFPYFNNINASLSHSTVESSVPDLNLESDSSTEGRRVVFDVDLNLPPPPEN